MYTGKENTDEEEGVMTKLWNIYKGHIITMGVIIAVMVLFFATRSGEENLAVKYEGADLSGGEIGRANTYIRYLERHADVPPGSKDIPVDIFSYTAAEGVTELADFEGGRKALLTEEDSFVEYTVHLDHPGFYNLYLEYLPVESRGIAVERSLKINGEAPFLGAEQLVFQRVWGDAAGGVRTDNQGNEIRPAQVEKPRWETAQFKDPLGYTAEPYMFYFKAGENSIRLEGINEPMAIRAFVLAAVTGAKSYAEYAAGFDPDKFKNSDTAFMLKIQGEDAAYRSDPSLYAVYDRSSGATEPPSVAKIKLNMIGGQNWRVSGQWIEWEFTVPEDGMYRISVKARQNYNRGFVSNRSVLIDGQIPCGEVSAAPFRYDNKWRLVTFQDEWGKELYFPLTKGGHSLRLQAALGELGGILKIMEESVYRLNVNYRKILVLTGPDPDVYRDYRVDVVYPEIITAMALESKILYKLVDDLTFYSGERGAQAAAALTLARQLELFVRRPDKIPRTLVNFKNNISALGDSLIALAQSQLDIDYILISAAEAELPSIKEDFFLRASHEIRSFIASFFVDYNNLGDVYKGRDAIEVWMLAGRDQSTILKAMIDDTFTPKTGIRVNVKLVTADAVMPSVVAGVGPDAAITVQQADPVNYAVRKAAMDIAKFDGFDELAKQFDGSVFMPFRYAGGVYALPETQYFHVMFYRKDIFEELGIKIPETWDDLISILPVIQKNNMNVGIPSVATTVQASIDFSNFLAHLYQRHGTLYNEDGSRTMLDGEIAIEAFDAYSKFFTHYKTPMVFDFVNRFRTGEMPLGFADYTNFNTLEVFAPEIRGLWGFAPMPGIRQPDGTIDRSVPTGTLASMIFSNADNPGQAWEFLKWWVSADTQLRFGRELESVMGAAARYPTANFDAFTRLSWGAEEMAVLREQRSWTVGTPEVPGGYYVTRHITNAVRRVLNEGEDTRETLLDYSLTINDELIKKRKEFGLE
ncbi:MAG: extracellular solute-binding protein [Treponema sp.]|jgi:ABC-type glycerol-3-phosphate transport system substrate-binding protein|nr:extracellular solute-binding protein [Treponema sp.]